MNIFHSMGHVVGGTLLIAGTAVGVGMLALPVATASGGFLPALTVYVLSWLFMLATGLLLVEVCLMMPNDTNFISMAEKILGTPGKAVVWLVYLFLFITVMIAHVAGGGEVLEDIVGWDFPHWVSTVIYTAIFMPVVYLGAHSVDRLNMVLIGGVIICYAAFIALSAGSIDTQLLKYANWGKAWVALPIIFTAFTYQVIIPTLVTYMKHNAKKIRLAVILGSSIPVAIYIVWEFLILSIIPIEGPHGLIETGRLGQNAIGPLKYFVQHPEIAAIGRYFAFFALTASFITLALSFFDFLADGLKWKKRGANKAILCLAVFGIPLLIALQYPHIFLVALGYAGGVSCAILFGLMPPLMAWIGRYRMGFLKAHQQLPGGRWLLAILMAFALFILGAEFIQQAL